MNSVKNGKIEGMGMISIKKIVGALIVLFVIIVNLNKSYGIYEKEILFISSYSPEFISFKDQVKGIKDTLGDEFNLQVQYMNAKSFSDKVDESDFYNLLKYSIASYKNLEGILIGDDDALEFYLKYKEDLFKDIPASFFGIYDKKNIERALKYKNVAGVREVESLDQIIELIRKHHKNVENIVFIDNDKLVNIKDIIILNDILSFNFNDKTIITKLYNKLSKSIISNVEIDNELKKYFMKISNILYDEIEYYNVDIDLNEEIDLVKYFKLAGIEFDNKHNNLIEKFIDILEIYSELYDQTMIFINVLTYFSNEEIREILKYITYKKISVLFLENSYNRSVYFENKYVIDDDFYDYIIHDDKS